MKLEIKENFLLGFKENKEEAEKKFKQIEDIFKAIKFIKKNIFKK